MKQAKYLPCILSLSCMLGFSLTPTSEPVTPPGLKVVPGTASRAGDQVVQGSDKVLHIVFRVFKNRKTTACYSHRTPDGVWSEPIELSADETSCEDPFIVASSSGRLISSWIDTTDREGYSLLVRSSEDGGRNWTPAFRCPSGLSQVQPRMATSGRHVYICFSSAPVQGAGERVYFLVSHDDGQTWGEKQVDFKASGHFSSQVQLLSRGESVWLTWRYESGAGAGVVVNRSNDGGDTWLPEPVSVNQARPERPLDPMFDPSGEDVGVIWHADYPGSKAIIYENRSADGVTWGKDRVLFESKVIPVTYRIVRVGNDRCLFWIGSENLKRGQKQIYCVKLTYPSQVPLHQEVIRWQGGEQAYVSEFDVNVLDGRVFLAALARFGIGDWRLLLLSRKADGEEQSWVVGEGGRKERSSLALVRFGEGIGWLYHERKARTMPMESLSGSLVFGRLRDNQ